MRDDRARVDYERARQKAQRGPYPRRRFPWRLPALVFVLAAVIAFCLARFFGKLYS